MVKGNLSEDPEKTKDMYSRLRGIGYLFSILLFCSMLIFTGNRAEAAGKAEAPAGECGGVIDLPEKTGEIIEKKGKQYYKYEDGKKAKSEFITVDGKTYYFGKNGVMEKGWMKKGKDYYYFNRSTGVQKKKGTVDGVKIKDGKAKKTAYSKKKITAMITAKNIVKKNTKATDSKEQKRKKMFNWVMKAPYQRYRILPQARKKKGWEVDFANDIFKKGRGCCVSEACALAFLAHECGYAAYVCDDGEHAWTEINDRVFDVLFARRKNKSEYNRYYNSTYKKAKLYRVNKLKI